MRRWQGLKRVCNRSLGSHPGRTDPGFPDFLVDLVGVDGLHAVFSYGKPHTRLCPVQRGRKSRFARDDKGEGSASIDEGNWDGRVRCAASIERSLSIRITKPNESVKFKFVIPSEPGFPATLHWTQPRVRFSVGENRMKSVNANKINQEIRDEGSAVRPDGSPSFGFSHTPFSLITEVRYGPAKA